jgi:hypothetical protein
MGMRVGNFDLQQNSLSAAGPLYASVAKSNYTTAIAHHLSIITAHPELEEKLRYCDAFKIPMILTKILTMHAMSVLDSMRPWKPLG